MRLITQPVPMNFNLFQFSCTHWGSTFTHKSGWQQLVDMMNSPFGGLPASANYGIHHGDLIEGKLIDDRHFIITGSEPGGIIPQYEKSIERLTPIKKKLITILQGNHERKLQARWGDITASVCNALGVPYGTYAAKIAYRSKRNMALLFKQYATHGRRQVSSNADDVTRRESNLQLSLKRHLKYEAGDTVLMTKGHTHQLFVLSPKPQLYLHDDGERIRQDYTHTVPYAEYINPDLRWYVNVGAFFRKYGDEVVDYDYNNPQAPGARSSYVEENEYPPIELGFAIVMVRDGEISDVVIQVVD